MRTWWIYPTSLIDSRGGKALYCKCHGRCKRQTALFIRLSQTLYRCKSMDINKPLWKHKNLQSEGSGVKESSHWEVDKERRMEEVGMRGERGKGTGSKCQAKSWMITQGLVIMPRRAQRQAAVVWMSDHTYLPPVCPSPALPFCLCRFLTRTHSTPCAASVISGPLHEINWPPTKDSKSQITSSEKWAIAITVTEYVENLFKYVIPKHGLSQRAPWIARYLLTIMN